VLLCLTNTISNGREKKGEKQDGPFSPGHAEKENRKGDRGKEKKRATAGEAQLDRRSGEERKKKGEKEEIVSVHAVVEKREEGSGVYLH